MSNFNNPVEIEQVPSTYNGTLGRRERMSIFRFDLAGRSSLNLTLNGTRNTDLTLFNGDKAKLASSRKPGRQADQISTTLEAGTYYIRVDLRAPGASRYTLKLAAN